MPIARPGRSSPLATLVLSAAAFPLLAAATAAQDSLPTVYPADSLRGEAAIARLGDALPERAAAHHMTAAELVALLRTDDTLWVSGRGDLFYVDPAAPAEAPDDAGSEEDGSFSGDVPQAFQLSSNPGADKTIYLDFDGHHSVSNSWGHNIVFPAYDTSGDPDTFTSGELNEIVVWWKRITEHFSPWDVNVTTVEPPTSDLIKSNSGDVRYGVRCVVTQPTAGFGNGIGGVALLNSFNDSTDNPCFNFNKGNATGSMTVSHEAGHTLGLSHDGLNGQSYHPGSGSGATSWGPVMGAPFGASLVQWSNGDYPGSTTTQNDTTIIASSSNGINLVPDDHGNHFGAASPVSAPLGCPNPTPGTAQGTIETRTDVDAFTFTTDAGDVTVSVEAYNPGGALDVQMDVLDGAGQLIVSVNEPNIADANVTLSLAAGTYYVLVDGVGKPDAYSDYGSLGRYTVSVSPPGLDSFADLGGAMGNTFGLKPALVVSGVLCADNPIQYNLGLARPNAPAFLIIGFSQLDAPFKGGVLVPNPAPPGAIVALQTSFLGGIVFSAPWPAGAPSGLEMILQYWIQDPLGPVGFTSSNAYKLTAP